MKGVEFNTLLKIIEQVGKKLFRIYNLVTENNP